MPSNDRSPQVCLSVDLTPCSLTCVKAVSRVKILLCICRTVYKRCSS